MHDAEISGQTRESTAVPTLCGSAPGMVASGNICIPARRRHGATNSVGEASGAETTNMAHSDASRAQLLRRIKREQSRGVA